MMEPVAPRDFCGDAYPWPLIQELGEGTEVLACYIVLESRKAATKAGKPFLRLVLGDRTGTIDAVIWDDAERLESICAAESVIGVRARVQSYNSRLQLTVTTAQPLQVAAHELERFLPASPRPLDMMERELDALVASVRDRGLARLLKRCVGRSTALGRAYRTHPAATRNHHAYVGGLLEHSLSVAGAAAHLAEHYKDQGFAVDSDVLIAAALLHDIGKVKELSGFPANAYTTEGRLLGHIVIGMQMVKEESAQVPELEESRVLHLLHLIASHQGKPEWDSPRVPQTVEALILHHADDLDAKLNQVRAALDGVAPGDWSAYERTLERALYRAPRPGRPGTGAVSESGDATLDMFGS